MSSASAISALPLTAIVAASISRGRWLCALSSVLLALAALQAMHFQRYVRASDEDNWPLPGEVVAELLLSLAVGVVGCSLWSGSFHSVSAVSSYALRSYDSLSQHHSDFASFSHRGRAAAQISHARHATTPATTATPHQQ